MDQKVDTEKGVTQEALEALAQGRGRHMRGANKLLDLTELYAAALMIGEHRKAPKDLAVEALNYATAVMQLRNAVVEDAHSRDMAEAGFQEQTREDLEREAADTEPQPEPEKSCGTQRAEWLANTAADPEPVPEKSDKLNPDGSTPTYAIKADTGQIGAHVQALGQTLDLTNAPTGSSGQQDPLDLEGLDR